MKQKKIMFVEDCQFGMFKTAEETYWQFDYDNEKDEGLGTVENVDDETIEQFTIIETYEDEVGNMSGVLIKI